MRRHVGRYQSPAKGSEGAGYPRPEGRVNSQVKSRARGGEEARHE